MDAHCAALGVALALDRVAVGIDGDQVARRDLASQEAVGLDQEVLRPAQNLEAEVVPDAVVEAKTRRQPMCRRQVNPGFVGRIFDRRYRTQGACRSPQIVLSRGDSRAKDGR